MRFRGRAGVFASLGAVAVATAAVLGGRPHATTAGRYRPAQLTSRSGVAQQAQDPQTKRPQLSGARDLLRGGRPLNLDQPAGQTAAGGLSARLAGANLRVSRDNSNLPQNETTVAINPLNPRNVVVGANDYRMGTGQTGFYASPGGGSSVAFATANGTDADGLLPFLNTATSEAWDGGGDPAADFDANGRVYMAGLAFNRIDCDNAVIVSWSDNGGLTWTRPSVGSGQGVAAYWGNKTDCSVIHDKESLAVDRYSAGPRRNAVYVTWTLFGPADSPIVFSQSLDGGLSWSPAVEISGANAAVCTAFTSNGRCSQDQYSYPAVGSDGTIYVVFYNLNTPGGQPDQFLMVKCAPTSDCATAAAWSTPVKIGDVSDRNLPLNSDGRFTLSNSDFRLGAPTANLAIDRTVTPNRLYAAWSDNRNGGSASTGNGASGGTDFDVFVAASTDGGATWAAATKANQDNSRNDQFQPWIAASPVRGRAAVAPVCVSYFDRRADVANKINDVFASCSPDGGSAWADQKLNDAPQNLVDLGGFEGGDGRSRFIGDYTGLTAGPDGNFVAAWTDTRNSVPSLRQTDIFAVVFTPPGSASGGTCGRGCPPSTPVPPARFTGTVTIGGVPAPDGTLVTAIIGRTECGTGMVSGGSYTVDVPHTSTKPGCGADGATVTFRMRTVRAGQTGVWQAGAFITLNLAV